jgi:uncharacterized protein YbjT (DUF2867 family)
MDLAVLGSAGATGRPLLDQALGAGHAVKALARSREQLTVAGPGLHVVVGDATDRGVLAEVMAGADAVISVLGARGPVMAQATRAIVSVAEQSGPERVVVLSSFAVERERLDPIARFVTALAMGSQIKDKADGEEVLRASSLDWTIVYATRLTNGPQTEPRVVPATDKVGLSQKISRASVASFLLKVATKGGYDRQGVIVTG